MATPEIEPVKIVKPAAPTKRFKPERIDQMNFKIKTEDDPVDDRGIA